MRAASLSGRMALADRFKLELTWVNLWMTITTVFHKVKRYAIPPCEHLWSTPINALPTSRSIILTFLGCKTGLLAIEVDEELGGHIYKSPAVDILQG